MQPVIISGSSARPNRLRLGSQQHRRRLRAELRAEGHIVGRYALRSWLHRHHLQVLSTRRHRTPVADPAAIVAENRLLGQPAPTRPN